MPTGDVMCVRYRSSNLYCIHFKNSQLMKSFAPSSIIDEYYILYYLYYILRYLKKKLKFFLVNSLTILRFTEFLKKHVVYIESFCKIKKVHYTTTYSSCTIINPFFFHISEADKWLSKEGRNSWKSSMTFWGFFFKSTKDSYVYCIILIRL